MKRKPYLPAGMSEEQFQRAAEKCLQVPGFAEWVAEGIEVLGRVQGGRRAGADLTKSVNH